MSVGFIDMKLKIWKFEPSHKNYILNTEVATPHNGRITALAFQPGFLGNEWPCLVSIGQDLKFKMWRLAEDADGNRRKTWTCDVAGDFRNLMPTALSFSEDGSLLAIAFQDIVTLWDPSVASVSATLAHPAVQEPIEYVQLRNTNSVAVIYLSFKLLKAHGIRRGPLLSLFSVRLKEKSIYLGCYRPTVGLESRTVA